MIFFSETDRVKIREAVATVERQTAGEVAVMVVDESDRYLEAVDARRTVSGRPASPWWCIGHHQVTIWLYLPLVFATYLPARYLVSQISPPETRFHWQKTVRGGRKGPGGPGLFRKATPQNPA